MLDPCLIKMAIEFILPLLFLQLNKTKYPGAPAPKKQASETLKASPALTLWHQQLEGKELGI